MPPSPRPWAQTAPTPRPYTSALWNEEAESWVFLSIGDPAPNRVHTFMHMCS